ncbi:alpha/beta hydrolase [Modestobacter sp. VKM Ac-2978]|uniref:alpha/beta hydrolase n=1 Tax=Modestobacter sp. VKM Ac-2978 TaxID=3004132 RepID=UPI0022AAA1E0|nr:alpha/beta hydrolase [Modestobacter sp. VKM Ac-2978]MCZ2849906.1 alpha/beta hydrolase [Modestobacter sp. VKM Ac-2978]
MRDRPRTLERSGAQLYREFRTQEEIDEQYRIDAIEPDFIEAITRHAQWSAATREELTCRLGVRYGPTLDETFDFFPADAAGAPVLVFIHGGYWHAANSAKDFSLVARAAVSRGVSVAVADYSLTPKVSLPEITRQMRALIAHLVRDGHELGIDTDRVVVAGHSAGGQQVAQLMLTDWEGEYGLPADAVKAGLAISGLFDLSPFPYSWLAPRLLLTHDVVSRESPLFGVRHVPGELLVTYGGRETPEFARQSAEFLAAWHAHGNAGAAFDLPGATHMSAFEGYADSGSELWRRTEWLFTGTGWRPRD